MPKGTTKKDATINQVLKAINDFSTDQEKRFQGIDQRFQGIDQRFQGIDQRFEAIDQRFQDFTTNLLSKVALKTDLESYATKADLKTLEDKLVTKLDRIIVNTERLETERVSHLAWLQRHEISIDKINIHLKLPTAVSTTI